MKINSLSLRSFRNINQLDLELNEHMNIFYGDNGQGKTNILEAVVFLSSGRSFRSVSDDVMIQKDHPFSKIVAEVDSGTVLTSVLSDQGKHLTVNGSVMKRLSEFIGHVNIVLFAPDDLNFFSQTPRLRRRTMDYELGKMSETYVQELVKATKILAERNAYLKSQSQDEAFLDVLSEKLALHSLPVMNQRKGFCEFLSPIIQRIYQTLSQSDATVEVVYHTFSDLSHGEILSKMERSRRRDIEFRMTHQGIHRDDYSILLNGSVVQEIASQGQKRMLMLAFKLAIVEAIRGIKGQAPILCLDDLFSELDEKRRKLIFGLLNPDTQVLITTTDLSFTNEAKNPSIFNVIEGIVERKK